MEKILLCEAPNHPAIFVLYREMTDVSLRHEWKAFFQGQVCSNCQYGTGHYLVHALIQEFGTGVEVMTKRITLREHANQAPTFVYDQDASHTILDHEFYRSNYHVLGSIRSHLKDMQSRTSGILMNTDYIQSLEGYEHTYPF